MNMRTDRDSQVSGCDKRCNRYGGLPRKIKRFCGCNSATRMWGAKYRVSLARISLAANFSRERRFSRQVFSFRALSINCDSCWNTTRVTMSQYRIVWPSIAQYRPPIWSSMMQYETIWLVYRNKPEYDRVWPTMVEYGPLSPSPV